MFTHTMRRDQRRFPMFVFVILFVLGISFFLKQQPDGRFLLSSTVIVPLHNGDTYSLVAASTTHMLMGSEQAMLGYNGTTPGPTIKVHVGDTITLHLINKMDMPTRLHAHGVRMDNEFDGTALTQKEILPGGTFDYVLTFPDSGVYWYHSDVRQDKTTALGLYGSIIVESEETNKRSTNVHEEVLMLGDALIENNRLASFSDQYITHVLSGRYGNTLLVNGRTHALLSANMGQVMRLYLVNTASARPFYVGIDGAVMKLIGGDSGPYENEKIVDHVLLAPGERAVIDVLFAKEGQYLLLDDTPEKSYLLGSINIQRTSGHSIDINNFRELHPAPQDTLSEFADARMYQNEPPDKKLQLSMDVDTSGILKRMPQQDFKKSAVSVLHRIGWEDSLGDLNLYSTSIDVHPMFRDLDTGNENMGIDWKFAKGNKVKIRMSIDATSPYPMAQSVHFHGNRFVVLSTNGVPNKNMAWKDTLYLRAGDTVDVLFDAWNVGKWLVESGIPEHTESGMTFGYLVE